MNRKERIMKTIRGEETDRMPVCFWHHFGNLEPEETVKAHLKWLEDSGEDLLKMMCDEFFTYPMRGAKSPEEMLRLQPLGAKDGYVTGQVERAAQINEALRGEVCTLYNAFSPYATLKHTLGDRESMELIRNHEDAALHLMEIICEDTCDMVEGILTQSGTMGMMLCLQGAEEGRFTDEEYDRWIRPTEEKVIACAQKYSENNLLHMCGWDGIPDRLERWEHYETAMINWDVDVEKISLKEGKERFGKRVVLGGFNNRPGTILPGGSKEEIQAFARELVRETGKERLIIGADCSLPKEIDPMRVRWVIEALEDV